MPVISLKYMTVSVDVQPEGISIAGWMSTVDFWNVEKVQYPYPYTHVGRNCTWLIHANQPLAGKLMELIIEYADRMCDEQARKNDRRKLANR